MLLPKNWLQFFCIIKCKLRFKSTSEKKRKPSSSITCTPSSEPYVSDHNQTRAIFHSCKYNLFFRWLSSQLVCSSGWAVKGTMWQFQVLEQLYTSSHTHSPWLLQGRPGRKAKSLQQRLQAFQVGKSKDLHLRAQLLRCSLREKNTLS